MALRFDKPVPVFVVDTPSIRRRTAAALAAATARAEYRFGIARIAHHTPGTLDYKLAGVLGAMAAGEIPNGTPSPSYVARLAARYRDGERSVADYRDDRTPRGPRPKPVSDAVVDAVEELAKQHGTGDLKHLAYLVNVQVGSTGDDQLSTWRLRRVLHRIGRHGIAAARNGSRAAELDTLPRGTYPTTETHEFWGLDEGDTRFYARAVCRVYNTWVSVRPAIIIIRDHCSGAILAALVVDPTRRIDKAKNRSHVSGFDADDVLAALLSAACEGLARPELRELADTLCGRLRWDNAPSHKALEERLFVRGQLKRAPQSADPDADDEFGAVVGEGLGDGAGEAEVHADTVEPMRAKRNAKRRPDRNGFVERIMGVAKRWLVGPQGHVDEVLPVDRPTEGEDLGRERSVVATSTAGRQSRITPVAVRVLPTIAELQRAVDEVVRRYNTEHTLKRHGMAPVGAARKYAPRTRRRADDLVRLLGARDYKVQREGIVIERNGRAETFEAVNNGILLDVGSVAQVYVDPLLRMAWLEQGRKLIPLRPASQRAAERDAATVAGAQAAAVREASDAEVERRDVKLDAEHGAGTAAEGWEGYKARRRVSVDGDDDREYLDKPPIPRGDDATSEDVDHEDVESLMPSAHPPRDTVGQPSTVGKPTPPAPAGGAPTDAPAPPTPAAPDEIDFDAMLPEVNAPSDYS